MIFCAGLLTGGTLFGIGAKFLK